MEKKILRQSAVLLARVLGFVEIADLISGIKMPVGELMRKLADHYAFERSPRTLGELDLSKGIELLEGVSVQGSIKKFVIYDTVLVVETRINTSASKAILEEVLLWGAKELGLNHKPNSLKRFGYVSDVTFYSDAPLLNPVPAVAGIAARASKELSEIWEEPVKYEPLNFGIGHDPSARKYGIAPFTLAHRAETKFSENKYFSESPLPTDIHWEILEQYEKDILAAVKG